MYYYEDREQIDGRQLRAGWHRARKDRKLKSGALVRKGESYFVWVGIVDGEFTVWEEADDYQGWADETMEELEREHEIASQALELVPLEDGDEERGEGQ